MTQAEILNVALAKIGGRARVASLSEDTEEARHGALLWEPLRNAALRAHDWSFASKRASLTCLSELDSLDQDYVAAPEDWLFVYELPSDCVAPRGFILPTGFSGDQEPFEIGISGTLDRRLFYCNVEDAVLRYTAAVEDTDFFDDGFVDAFSWKLAAELALPLTGDSRLRGDAEAGYRAALSSAQASSANERGRPRVERDASWVRERG